MCIPFTRAFSTLYAVWPKQAFKAAKRPDVHPTPGSRKAPSSTLLSWPSASQRPCEEDDAPAEVFLQTTVRHGEADHLLSMPSPVLPDNAAPMAVSEPTAV